MTEKSNQIAPPIEAVVLSTNENYGATEPKRHRMGHALRFIRIIDHCVPHTDYCKRNALFFDQGSFKRRHEPNSI